MDEKFKIFTGEDIQDFATDLANYSSEIDIWRILFTHKSLFPCDGFGFIVESKDATVFYDGLGRRIGSKDNCLKDYIKAISEITYRRDQTDLYEIICKITLKEFEEIKKMQFDLELAKSQSALRESRTDK